MSPTLLPHLVLKIWQRGDPVGHLPLRLEDAALLFSSMWCCCRKVGTCSDSQSSVPSSCPVASRAIFVIPDVQSPRFICWCSVSHFSVNELCSLPLVASVVLCAHLPLWKPCWGALCVQTLLCGPWSVRGPPTFCGLGAGIGCQLSRHQRAEQGPTLECAHCSRTLGHEPPPQHLQSKRIRGLAWVWGRGSLTPHYAPTSPPPFRGEFGT